MVKRSKSATGTSILPSRSLPCVWMSAGLLAYKLCDRAYDCEHCPLDAALRGMPHHESETAQRATTPPPPPGACDFPANRRYHPGHAWVQEMAPDRVRCGIDAFGAWLLHPAKSVVLPAPPTRVPRGGILGWLGDATALVPLRTPIDGVVLNVHPDVQVHPERVTSSPYDKGWLLELHCPGGITGKQHLNSAPEQRERTRKQLERLERWVAPGHHPPTGVGATLADGGQKIADLRHQLGEQRFKRFIRWVFRDPGV